MPDGTVDKEWVEKELKRLSECLDKEVDRLGNRIDNVWGEYGLRAVWSRLTSVESKLWYILVALIANGVGVVAVLLTLIFN